MPDTVGASVGPPKGVGGPRSDLLERRDDGEQGHDEQQRHAERKKFDPLKRLFHVSYFLNGRDTSRGRYCSSDP